MHDIWNPWHGCIKCSPGCENCYMYYLDEIHDMDGSKIYKSSTNFNYPLKKDRQKNFKIQSGELIRLCMTSDFFLKEADDWRPEIWEIIKKRSDVIFFFTTKRAERIVDNLPKDWGDGYENVFVNVTCENQQKADERIPILLDLPAKHKGIMCTPCLTDINIDHFLEKGQIEQIICGGENYSGARPLNYDWVINIHDQCVNHNIKFCFMETGTVFIKDGKRFFIPNKQVQAKMAYKSGMNFEGKPIDFILKNSDGEIVPKEDLFVPMYNKNLCKECGSRAICNGCSNCGKCKNVELVPIEKL